MIKYAKNFLQGPVVQKLITTNYNPGLIFNPETDLNCFKIWNEHFFFIENVNNIYKNYKHFLREEIVA